MFEGISNGLATALAPFNLLMVTAGCFAGTFIGMLPGLGPISAVALMIPLTYGLDPASGLILMAGVYYGAVFGGSTASILINAPGTASTVATTFDGYPLARAGQAGRALALAAYASFTGGTLGAVGLLVAAPLLANLALGFQSPEYFALMVLGLTAVTAFTERGRVLPACMMTVLGMMLGTVGADTISGLPRLHLGRLDLIDGFSFLLLAMAMFALAEVVASVLDGRFRSSAAGTDRNLGTMRLTRAEVREVAPVTGRSSVLGFLIGVLPGVGATLASFLVYGFERNLARGADRERFGRGSLRGLAAPEAANNAASTGSFVPLLTLGIPGSGTTAILLGALIAYGIQPGPRLFVEHPDVFWSVIVSMYVGNVVLLLLNLPLIPYFARLLRVPGQLLVPLVILFCVTGVYLVSFNTVDILIMVAICVVALVLKALGFPLAPVLLGFILGDYLEANLQRSLILYDGSFRFLWERPACLVIMLVTLAVAVAAVGRGGRRLDDVGEPD
ncbi:MAG: tripartite tricarboxylate transporter permease [Pseudomonadota bacterium]